jgi:hypothetical protein
MGAELRKHVLDGCQRTALIREHIDHGVSELHLTGTTRAGKNIRVRGCDLFEFNTGKVTK